MGDSRETLVNTAFVVGFPIRHSRSPLIHRQWLKQFQISGDYRAHEVHPGEFAAFIASLREGTSGFCGGNVTIPHKEQACTLADRLDPLAEELGAANTLWLEEGRIHATNTDGYGFTANMDAGEPDWDRADSAVILGAGGASRAIVQAVRDRGIKTIHLLNRSPEKARALADRFGPKIQPHPLDALPELLAGAGLFINTTSLGMDTQPAPEINFSAMRPDAIVTDIVYVPLRTSFLRQAAAQGFRTVDGLGMLLHQAAPGFARWFGRMPVVDDALRHLVIADMEAHG